MERIMFTILIKRFISNLFNLNFLIINLFSFHAVTTLGILFSLIFLLTPACQRDLSPVKKTQIKLSVEYTEATEVWLKLEVLPLDSEAVFTVRRDSHTVFYGKLNKSDTLLHDENLEPAHNYSFSAYREVNGKAYGYKAQATTTTMDTTSHTFDRYEYFFGDNGGWFNDVCVISENDVWAVGKIYVQDTLYNCVHWNGTEWSLIRIPRNLYDYVSYGELYAIDGIAQNDIWFSGGATFVHWDGNAFTTVAFLKEYLEDPDYSPLRKLRVVDGIVYAGSYYGNLIQFNGSNWQKLETATNSAINDIFHIQNDKEEQPYILATVSDVYLISTDMIIQITDINVEPMFGWQNTFQTPYSIWFMDKNKYWVCGGSIYIRGFNKKWYEDSTFTYSDFLFGIRGSDKNDIFVVGDRNFISHFNGSSWYNISQNYSGGRYYRLDIGGDLMATVGRKNNKATILMLFR
jgi:hypothetical protein